MQSNRQEAHHPTESSSSVVQMGLSTLPDHILVHIGTSVAKLCGLRDFVHLSRTSKRFHNLLLADTTVSEVIRIRTNSSEETQKHTLSSRRRRSSTTKTWLPAYALKPIQIHSLEQLSLYESVKRLNLLRENRLCESPNLERDNRVHFEYSDLQICNHDESHVSCMGVIHAIATLLKRHPTVSVILDSHAGTRAPEKSAWLYSHVRGRVVHEAVLSGLNPVVTDKRIRLGLPTRDKHCPIKTRVSMRAWGQMVTKIVSESQPHHPYQEMAQSGKGWIEVYFKMDDDDGGTPLVLPPRPSYYNLVAQIYYKKNNNNSSSSSKKKAPPPPPPIQQPPAASPDTRQDIPSPRGRKNALKGILKKLPTYS